MTASSKAATPSTPVILLVEDEAAHVELARRALREAGAPFAILPVSGIGQACALLETTNPALILSDWRLPDGLGVDIIHHVGRRVPVVIMTSQGDEAVAVDVMRAGALDYVVKSFTAFQELPHVVERALREWNLLRERERSRERFRAQYDCVVLLSKAQTFEDVAPLVLERAALHLHATLAELWLKDEGTALCRQGLGEQSTSVSVRGRGDWVKTLWPRLSESELVLLEEDDCTFAVTPMGSVQWAVAAPIFVAGQPHSLLLFAGLREHMESGAEARLFVQALGIQLGAFIGRCLLQEELVERERLAALGTAMAVFAHEVGNPLNNLSLQGQALERRLQREQCSDSAKASVRAIRSEVVRLAALLQEFRALSRRQSINPREVYLQELLDGLVAAHFSRDQYPDLHVRVAVSPTTLSLRADPDKLVQVFINLIKNAAEATANQGNVEISATEVDQEVVIVVTDDGPGIREGLDPFALFETTKEQGTGLGLPVVRQIVCAHGGRVVAANRAPPEHGAMLTVWLPLVADGVLTSPPPPVG